MTASGSSAARTSAARSDLGNLHRIQRRILDHAAIEVRHPLQAATAQEDRHQVNRRRRFPALSPDEDPLAFYAALGKEMLKFPAPAADRPLLAQLRTVGIGPGLDPANAHLSADTLRGLRDAVSTRTEQGPGGCARALPPGVRHAQRLPDHRSRRLGHELHPARDRRHARRRRPAGEHRRPTRSRCSTTRKAPLTGSKRYVVHIPKSSLPIPVKAFWSLTMYDTDSFFVPNPLNRYLINNRSHLHTQPRRLDRHLRPARPAVEPGAGEQLAARTRHRARVPPGLAPVRPRPRRLRRARRLGLAAATRPAV